MLSPSVGADRRRVRGMRLGGGADPLNKLLGRSLGLRSVIFLALVTSACAEEWPGTRAERSEYRETSRYEDVMGFLEALDGRHRWLHQATFGYSEEGRALPLVVFGDVEDASPGAVRAADATRILVFANIHAGEVAGKEAAQVLLRELAKGERDRWADSLVLLVVPIYNADGNERTGLRNRPRQHGPFAGMGQRPNARGLDLNRDNTKLESAEARALSRLVQDYDPHVAIDLHTTNGTFHAYYLTYAPPLHPSTDPAITGMLRDEWLPEVTKTVRDRHGWDFFYYGNVPSTWGMQREQGWYTFDHRPRFTTNYLGLRNRFGILSEAYSYATFEDRILAHERFVEAVIDFAFSNASRIRDAVVAADGAPEPGMEVALRADFLRGDSIEVLLGAVDTVRNPYTGDVMYLRRDESTGERMPDFGAFRAAETAVAPVAFLIPPQMDAVVERLEAHGIETARLTAEVELEASAFQIDSTRTAEREFQGHRTRDTWGSWVAGRHGFAAGTVVVPIRQPLGRLIVVLLDPRSDDGFVTWNLLDRVLEETGAVPIFEVQALPGNGCEGCERFR